MFTTFCFCLTTTTLEGVFDPVWGAKGYASLSSTSDMHVSVHIQSRARTGGGSGGKIQYKAGPKPAAQVAR